MKYGILSILFFVFHLTSYSNKLNTYYEKLYLEEELSFQLSELERYKHDLGMSESALNPRIINSVGAMGIWQFMPYTLRDLGLGHITPNIFRSNPEVFPASLQEYALDMKMQRDYDLLSYQWWRGPNSINYIEEFVGKEIKGVTVSTTGLLAAAHLGGAYGVIRFLDSQGKHNPSDINGTSISTYLKKFSNYNYSKQKTNELIKEIEWLEKLLNSSEGLTLLSEQSKLYSWEQVSRDTETVLILSRDQSLHHLGIHVLSKYPLGLKRNYLNTTGEFYTYVVPHLSNIKFLYQEAGEKLNGTMQKNGKVSYILLKELLVLKEILDYSNSTSNLYGMPHGTSKYWICFQYIGLKRLKNFPHLGAV